MEGNAALGQAAIQLAVVGGTGGIYGRAQKENACIVTELCTCSIVGATCPTRLIAPKTELIRLYIDLLSCVLAPPPGPHLPAPPTDIHSI
eukprot:66712-Ditylum_brightwellii.AAC.1